MQPLVTPKRFPENLPVCWKEKLGEEMNKDYFKALTAFLKTEFSKKKTIFPPRDKMLRALQAFDLDQVRVVILGQDPYHGPNQAMGLCFAVPNNLRLKPPSLQNIFKEIETDIGFKWNKQDSELSGWVEQGVLLLNTLLSVEQGKPLSHANRGWEIFTDRIIQVLSEREEPLVFLLWGSNAQKKSQMIHERHFILRAPHPSPLSAHRGFFGSKHFSKANEILKTLKRPAIDWTRINALT